MEHDSRYGGPGAVKAMQSTGILDSNRGSLVGPMVPMAASCRDMATLDVLLRHHANPLARNAPNVADALTLAAVNGDAALVTFLLDHGADVCADDRHFRKPGITLASIGRHNHLPEAVVQRLACHEPATAAAYGTEAVIEDFGTGDDGLLTLRVRGARRFRAERARVRDNGLQVAQVRWCEPDAEEVVRPQHSLLVTLLERLLEQAGGEHALAPHSRLDDAAWVGWRLAELLQLSLQQRQMLLQLLSRRRAAESGHAEGVVPPAESTPGSPPEKPL